jgi:pheromone shutdown protein TraB
MFPLQVSRVWGVLSLRQKLRLLYHMVSDLLSLKVDDALIEQLLQQDVIKMLQASVSRVCPGCGGKNL